MDIAGTRQVFAEGVQSLGRWLGLRGLVTLLLGVFFLVRPGHGVGILVAAFGIYCFLDAIAAFAAAFAAVPTGSRVLFVLEALLGVAAGIVTFARPGAAAVVILYVVAIRALIVGAMEVLGAITLGNLIPGPLLMALSGIASVIFGILLLRNPQAGLLSLAWLVGLYGVILGAAQIAAAVALRREPEPA